MRLILNFIFLFAERSSQDFYYSHMYEKTDKTMSWPFYDPFWSFLATTLISLINVTSRLPIFQKIPPSTFIPASRFSDLATFAPPPRLFQPPRLLKR